MNSWTETVNGPIRTASGLKSKTIYQIIVWIEFFKFTNPGMVSMAQSVDLSIATIIEHAGKNCVVQITFIKSRT